MIDYAHNAMALESLLTTLKSMSRADWSACSDAEETVQNPAVMRWERYLQNWQI
mgnify:CR=1 FL=1